MSDSAKKPAPAHMDDKTTITSDPVGEIPMTLNLADAAIDENYSFDQKTVVSFTPKTPVPTPPRAPEVPAATSPFKITIPKINTTTSAPPSALSDNTAVTAATQGGSRAGKGAVKMNPTAPAPMPAVAPGDELEFEKKRKKKAQESASRELSPFMQNALQNKKILVGIGGGVVLLIAFGVWKSHQPRQLDWHPEESGNKPSVTRAEPGPSAGAELPSAEQAALHFEAVFQRVQVDGGDVSR